MAWGRFFAIRLAPAASSASYQGSLPSQVYFSCTKPGKKDEPCSEGHCVQPSFWAMGVKAFQNYWPFMYNIVPLAALIWSKDPQDTEGISAAEEMSEDGVLLR